MADGSLRITLEFEPAHAKDAYALFGARGTPLAVAALQVGYAAAKEPDKPKPGPLCVLAARWCKEPKFWDWQRTQTEIRTITDEDTSASALRAWAGIESRTALDSPPISEWFEKAVRQPYMAYLKGATV